MLERAQAKISMAESLGLKASLEADLVQRPGWGDRMGPHVRT